MNNFLKTFNEFDEFFNDLDGWFGRPRHLQFNCKTKDMMPSFCEKTDDGYKCTCRTVGINSKDVKVELKEDCLHIDGKTKLDGYDYSVSYDLPLIKDVINNIKNIKYKTESGITIIYISLERPEKKDIKIEQIK